MNKKEQAAIIKAEYAKAEKYMVARLKIVGGPTFIDDGKTDILVSIVYQDLVRLLGNYGVARVAESVENGKHL